MRNFRKRVARSIFPPLKVADEPEWVEGALACQAADLPLRPGMALCHFDDLISSDLGHVGPAVGVPLAIDEFNCDIARRVLSPLNHLEFAHAPARLWHRQPAI